jgi:hypothetical protein
MAEKKEGTGLLGAAAIATPTAVGASIAARRIYTDRTTAANAPVAAMEAVGFAPRAAPPQIDMASHLKYMNNLRAGPLREIPISARPELLRSAWGKAMEFADPMSRENLRTFARELTTMPPADVFSAIYRTVEESNSALMNRVMNRFKTNVGALAGQFPMYGVPQFGAVGVPGVNVARLGVEDIPKGLAPFYEQAAGRLGAATNILEYTRPEFAGYRNLLFQFGEDVGLMVPMTHEGAFLEGKFLRTRYIAQDVALFDPVTKQMQRISRPEYLMKEFAETIAPQIAEGRLAGPDVDVAIKALRTKALHEMETISNVPDELRNEALRRYQRVRGQAVQVRVEKPLPDVRGPWQYRERFQAPTAVELSSAMEVAGFKAGTSPTAIAKGIVMGEGVDMRQWFITPEAADPSRRMEQSMRNWELAEDSWQASRERFGRYDIFNTAERRAAWATKHLPTTADLVEGLEGPVPRQARFTTEPLPPHLRTVYMDPERYAAQIEQLGIGEGGAAADVRLKKYLTQQTMTHTHLTSVNNAAMELVRAGKAAEVPAGTVLGWTQEGAPFVTKTPEEQRIVAATRFFSEGQGYYETVSHLETQRMAKWEKFFGDLKAVFRFSDPREIAGTVRGVGGEAIAQGVDIVASMDELKKNASLHNKQMITALWEMAENRPALSAAGEMFYKSPVTTMRAVSARAVTEAGYEHPRMVESLMRFAREEIGVTAREFGQVFGAVPSALGAEEAEALARGVGATGGQIAAMGEGLAAGRAQVFYGGTKELTGAGGLGSLEPRAFEMMRGGGFGQLGRDLSEEFAQRLVYTEPERAATHEALTRTLQSMVGKADLGDVSAKWDVAARGYERRGFQEWIEGLGREGGMLRLGGEFGDVFVPSPAALEHMQPFRTAGGQAIKGELSNIFHGLAVHGAQTYAQDEALSAAAMRQHIAQAAQAFHKHQAPAGKGMGGLLRGKLLGSRFLTGVAPFGREAAEKLGADVGVIGIPEQQAAEMLADIAPMYEKNVAFAEMSQRLLEGERVGGVVARHPFIGAYSVQPIQLQVMKSLQEPVMMLPSISQTVEFAGFGEKTLQMSPMLGMAGDIDADIFSASLVSPDIEQKIMKRVMTEGDEYTVRQAQHQLRVQLLKAKKAAGAMTMLDVEAKLRADVRKLGVTQRWVPRLSVEMTQARQAVLQFADEAMQADAQFLIEWLEQQPISAKHMSAKEIAGGHLEAQLQTLSNVMASRDERSASRLAGLVEGMVSKKEEDISRAILMDDLHIQNVAAVEKAMGAKVGRVLPSINLERTAETIMTSLRKYEESGQQVLAEQLSARGKPMQVKGLNKYLNVFTHEGAHALSGVSKAGLTAKNLIGAVGEGMIRHHKAIGFGFAGSLAVALALSSPTDTIGPGSALNKAVNLNAVRGKSASKMKPDDVAPPRQVRGSPTVPPMLHQNATRLSGQGQRIRVQSRGNYAMNTENFTENVRQMTPGPSSVNLNIRSAPTGVTPYLAGGNLFG